MGDYLAVMAAAAVVTMVCTSLVRAVVLRLGWVPPVRDRDMHDTPIPRFGGLALTCPFVFNSMQFLRSASQRCARQAGTGQCNDCRSRERQ